MHAGLTNKESVRDVWDSICKIHVGMDGVKEVNAEWLWQEFIDIRFKPREGVEDFSICIMILPNELRVLGD
jgi:hypothetical protein